MKKKLRLLVAVLVCLTITAGLFDFMPKSGITAEAATTLEQKRADFTNSDFLMNGSGKAIRDYRAQLYTTGVSVNWGSKRLDITGDDPIIHIIPKEEFTISGFRTFVGIEYAWIIDTWSDQGMYRTNVQVIDLNSFWSGVKIYDFEIKPLFEYEYAYIPTGSGNIRIRHCNVAGRIESTIIWTPPWLRNKEYTYQNNSGQGRIVALPVVHTPSTFIETFSFWGSNRWSLYDVSIAGQLENVNDANPVHADYYELGSDIAPIDSGAFFHGMDLFFRRTGVSVPQDTWQQSVWRVVKFGASVVPFEGIIGTIIDGAMNIMDFFDLVESLGIIPDPDEDIKLTAPSNLRSQLEIEYHSDRGMQISNYQKLVKLLNADFRSDINRPTEIVDLARYMSVGPDEVGARFEIGWHDRNLSKLRTAFQFSVRERNHFFGPVLTVMNGELQRYVTYDAGIVSTQYKTIPINEPVLVFNNLKNTSHFIFTIPQGQAGDYCFDLENAAHRIYVNGTLLTSSTRNLSAGTHTVLLEYENSASTSYLTIERAILNFTLINNNTAYSVKGLSNISHIDIPATYRGLPVKVIEASAFSGFGNLQTITIPEGITGIGAYAFANCTSLTSITIPAGVDSIGSNAFSGCNNLTITVQGASVPILWTSSWNSGRPVVFTVPGGCGLSHVFNYVMTFSNYHKKICINCNTEALEQHVVSIEFYTMALHWKKCSICTYVGTEAHTFINGVVACCPLIYWSAQHEH